MATATEDVVQDEVVSKKAPKASQRSYFQTNKLNRVVLDDGLSYIEHKLIDEGAFEEFQDLTSAVKVDQNSSSTEVDLGLGRTRKFLLERLVVGWNLVDDADNPLPFSYNKLMELPPHVIGSVVEDIYSKNPILSGESEGKETSKS